MGSDKTTRIEGSLKIEGELRLTSDSSTIAPLTQAWIDKHGMDQLNQLNAMERGQDVTTWSTNAIYSATNGVLIVATVAAFAYDVRWLIISLLGVLGAFLTTVWFTIVLRAHQYEIIYLYRARWLQMKCAGMPKECAIWQEPDSTPEKYSEKPPGTPSWDALRALVLGFFSLWSLLVLLSVVLGIESVQVTEISDEWQPILGIVAGGTVIVISSLVYCRFFWKPVKKTGKYFADLRKALGLPDS